MNTAFHFKSSGERPIGFDNESFRWPRWLAAFALALTFVASGCGDDGDRTAVHPTSGKLTYEGIVPEGALVVLHPKDATSPYAVRPTAKVQSDGSFALTTYETGDGAPAGDYVVTVTWAQAVQVGGDFVPGPELIPPKYQKPQTSDLVVSVAEGDNDLAPIVIRR